jgi:hypothetical protein
VQTEEVPVDQVLNLRVGEIVEVRSEAEILATLDARAELESLPFMPEMLQFCGRRFRVDKLALKLCDTIGSTGMYRMRNAVHLEGLRCDGQAHGGCQAGCLIYWKEAWLKRVNGDSNASAPTPSADTGLSNQPPDVPAPTTATIMNATRRESRSGEEIFSCQATELLHATTSPIPWWEPRQYVRDFRSGNAGILRILRGLTIGFFNKFQQANVRVLPRLTLIHGGRTYPFLKGRLTNGAPSGRLNLQPGELVEVKSKKEIFDTLDERDRTRGLRFDGEMLTYCGRRGRVLQRVEKIIDEKTGEMLSINSDCIIIEGFICKGDYHRFCPRSVYPYWREAWLKRVDEPVESGDRAPTVSSS